MYVGCITDVLSWVLAPHIGQCQNTTNHRVSPRQRCSKLRPSDDRRRGTWKEDDKERTWWYTRSESRTECISATQTNRKLTIGLTLNCDCMSLYHRHFHSAYRSHWCSWLHLDSDFNFNLSHPLTVLCLANINSWVLWTHCSPLQNDLLYLF